MQQRMMDIVTAAEKESEGEREKEAELDGNAVMVLTFSSPVGIFVVWPE